MSAYLDHKFDNGSVIDTDKLPDSLRYTTRHGRIVAGGGGIFPDHFVAIDSTSILTHPLFRVLNAQIADVRFVRSLFDREQDDWRQEWKDRQAEFTKSYNLDSGLLSDFWAFVDEKSLLGPNAAIATPAARSEIAPALKILLKARIAQNLFDSSAYYPVIQSLDADFRVAERTWPEARALARQFETE